jgi:aspartyl/asparaginyl beta-hydroxylase (cupin superfamily)
MINRIAPGGLIYPHPDTPEHCRYYSRFHLVLQSAEGVKFRAGDEWTYWETGSFFWFNNALEHEVINESPIDRIHLVMDARCSA